MPGPMKPSLKTLMARLVVQMSRLMTRKSLKQAVARVKMNKMLR